LELNTWVNPVKNKKNFNNTRSGISAFFCQSRRFDHLILQQKIKFCEVIQICLCKYFFVSLFFFILFNIFHEMDGNKDEAEKCIELAEKYMREGNREKAVKLLEKSERLYPTQKAKGKDNRK